MKTIEFMNLIPLSWLILALPCRTPISDKVASERPVQPAQPQRAVPPANSSAGGKQSTAGMPNGPNSLELPVEVKLCREFGVGGALGRLLLLQ
jgi:hypothetical protein